MQYLKLFLETVKNIPLYLLCTESTIALAADTDSTVAIGPDKNIMPLFDTMMNLTTFLVPMLTAIKIFQSLWNLMSVMKSIKYTLLLLGRILHLLFLL
jgi:hypothetical protein